MPTNKKKFYGYSDSKSKAEVMTKIEIEEKLSEVADYIVETGENENGNYAKWSSGRLEMFGWNFFDQTTNTAQIRTVNFPLPFKDTNYSFQFTLGRNGNIAKMLGECDSKGTSKRTTKSTQVFIEKTTGNYSIEFSWYVTGRWK